MRLTTANLTKYGKEIRDELAIALKYRPVKKDILMVVKDQLTYTKSSIESIYENTEDFELYVWDNGSDEETKASFVGILGAKDS